MGGSPPLSAEPAPSLFLELFREAVEVPGPETEAIGAACREADVMAVVGINERRPNTTGTLYNTQLFFGRDGALLHKHQKYVPTVGERIVHAPGQTGSKASVVADFGTLSGLICGENGNPRAGAVSTYSRSLASALMCFVINSVAVVGQDVIEKYGADRAIVDFLQAEKKNAGQPLWAPGVVLAGPLEEEEGIVYAEVDTEGLVKLKYGLDYAGHYNRPEIFAHHFERFLK
ncbi:unnamed protein product [Parascedosporium putredinis]|uniref:CN hydrolase domain-containing protein n=1 Tax=Parascedosporium putredinis TaxID=1442378 RepID=A0A9P1GXV8_9PEZI|nr:unnamed protein product [Parascedosporium putredinis]CAI7991039.1 unnamed protein product [Parascedosporium putredinis]